MKQFKTTSLLIVILIIIMIALIGWTKVIKRNNDIKEIQNFFDVTKAELIRTTNSLNQETVKREALVLGNTELLRNLDSRDSTIRFLQNTVARYENDNKRLRNVVVVLTNTIAVYEDSIKNTIVDMITINDTIFPTYRRDINMFDHWITGSVELGINKFNINQTVYNKYSVTSYTEKQGLFKRPTLYVEIHNENPYTTVIDFRDYQISYPKCNHRRSIVGGSIVGAVLTYLIMK